MEKPMFSMDIPLESLNWRRTYPGFTVTNVPVVPHKAVAEVSKIGNL